MKILLLVPLLAVAAAAQTYTVTDLGSQCGANLHGHVVAAPHSHTGTDLLLAVSAARPHALAILVIGHHAPTPPQLPGSACLLLVDPRATMLATTNAAGTAHFVFHVPPVVPITIDFQAVIATHSHQHGLVIEATDGVRLVGV